MGVLRQSQIRTRIAAVLAASIGATVCFASAGRPAPPVGGTRPSATAPDGIPDRADVPGWAQILAGFLLPVPPGYAAPPQVPEKPEFPVPLTPAERDCLLFPYARERAGHTMGWTQPD